MKERLGDTMKSCISENDYNRFIEDTLKDEELVCIKAHLKDCESCRAEFEGWLELKKALLTASEIEIPKTLKSRVMNDISKASILEHQALGIRRVMAAAVLILLMVGYIFQPVFKPVTDMLLKEGIAYFSELFYSVISFMGLDMKSVMSLFRTFISLFNELFWMFAISTFMLVVGFFTLILKGRAKLKTN